jgi:hypothetical protein
MERYSRFGADTAEDWPKPFAESRVYKLCSVTCKNSSNVLVPRSLFLVLALIAVT